MSKKSSSHIPSVSKRAEKKSAGYKAATRSVREKAAKLQKLIAQNEKNKSASKKSKHTAKKPAHILTNKKENTPMTTMAQGVQPRFIPKTKLIPVTRKINFHIVTLFPESFTSYISESIIARAQEEGRISIHFYNPRNFVKANDSQKGKSEPYLRVDDRPYGGGPGMIIEPMPLILAVEAAIAKADELASRNAKSFTPAKARTKVLFMSPGGKQFTNELAMNWVGDSATEAAESLVTDFIIISGRYEGVDERVNIIFNSEPITVGPFVLTGGELPAMIIMDAMARHIPGVLGNFDSREEARVASHAVYTRPEVLIYKGKEYKVPEVLLSGDHKKIEKWREWLEKDKEEGK